MCDSKITKEEESSFVAEAKLGSMTWVWLSMLSLVWMTMFLAAVFELFRFDHTRTYLDNYVAATFFFMAFAGVCLALSVGIFSNGVWDSRHRAIDQCRFVAERYLIEMSPRDVHHLAISLYAGSIFEQFYLLIKEKRPELIPEGFLEGSGGENWTASRRLVESLWNRYVEKTNQPDPVANEGVSVAEAPAT